MFIADFHIHSKYSRATSRDCVPEMLDLWARRKGLGLIGTGDFTHPAWRQELKDKLVPAEDGLYQLRGSLRTADDAAGGDASPRFIVTGEISSIYKKNGRVRKVHNLILLPGLEAAEKLSRRLTTIGNLHSDGRPILGLDARDLLEITLDTVPDAVYIPAHIWTPHFSLFGAYSGFDDMRECYEDLMPHIHALETGLSSDPPMNWRLSALDGFTLISNSDAHSPAKLAREANVLDTPMSYPDVVKALSGQGGFGGTIEFFPEEGKYHFDGHRNCKVCLSPAETREAGGVCPVCGGRITVGVLHRVEALADRPEGYTPANAARFESLVPLQEVVGSALGISAAGKKAQAEYLRLLSRLGPELFILREAPLEDITHAAGTLVAEGIRRLRDGVVEVEPGYDGEYGKVHVIGKAEISALSGQISLFAGEDAPRKKRGKSGKREAPTEPTQSTPEATAPVASVSGELNDSQREAVCADAPAIAVIAGPGTGKTSTLVSRIAYLVEERGVSPAQITAVTFTNRAAGELRERLEKRFGGKRIVKAMTIGTFHSSCLRILSAQGGHAVAIADEAALLALIQEILEEQGLKTSPRDVLRGISLLKNGALKPSECPDVPESVYEAYCQRLKAQGATDFDDIIADALALFEDADAAPVERFRHLLVDEFQDVNAMQYRLIRSWSRGSEGVFVIGDPDQAIYGFRGSDSRCFARFLADYEGARIIRLTANYRSTPGILRCALSALDAPRELEAQRPGGVPVRLLTAGDTFSEAVFIAKEVNRMVGGVDMLDAHALPGAKAVPRSLSDIAVLYRTNRQARTIEQCLIKEGVPYTVAGREDFLSAPQARAAAAFFRFLLNSEDMLSLSAYLRDGALLAPADAKRILAAYAEAEAGLASLAALAEAEGCGGSWLTMLQKYKDSVRTEKPAKLLEARANDCGLAGLECMELLVCASVMHGDMATFLDTLALGSEGDVRRSGQKKYVPDAVSLMTLHAAKGLEFPVVFLCGASDGLIPYRGRDGSCNLDEERRLLYVGMTRAKDELVLLTSSAPSPFLAALPADDVDTGKAAPLRKAEGKQLSLFNM